MDRTPKFDLCMINNHAAELIEQQEYSEALDALTSGIKLARRLIIRSEFLNDEDGRQTFPLPEEGSPSGETLSPPSFVRSDRIGTPDAFHEPESGEAALSVHEYLYTRPIFLPSDDCLSLSLSTYAFAMLFNMALSNHLGAIVRRQGRKFTFKSALDLYELAYTIHLQEDINAPLFHSCAIVNNTAHVQRSLNNEKGATQCFQHLLSILMLAVEGPGNVCGSSDSFVGFFHNVASIMLGEALCAPAA
jgi:hypothetical protein